MEELIKDYKEDLAHKCEEADNLKEEVEVLKIQNEKLRKANKRVADEVTTMKANKMKARSLAELQDVYNGRVDKIVFD